MIRAMAQRCYVMDKGRIVDDIGARRSRRPRRRPPLSRCLKPVWTRKHKKGSSPCPGSKTQSWPEGPRERQAGQSYAITEESQGKYHYVYGPFAAPVLRVDPGAVVSSETHDAFEGTIKYETDKPSDILNFPFLNPQNGPIFVNGAEKGDCLAVHIKSIVPRGTAAGRHHLSDQGIRRPCRHRRYGPAQ